MKKYEFTGETKEFYGRTLRKIRAIKDFGKVLAGDVGGWIESEENLSHLSSAWVNGDACVCDDARVSGNACVCDNALVSGNALVCGDACASGDACVCDDARVSGNAWVCGNAQVSDDAWVRGNACVSDDAQVGGDAQVHGNALICGDAWICGGVWSKSPCFIRGTRGSIYAASPNIVCCGEQEHTWREWHDNYAVISKELGADDVLEEYIRYFNLLCEMYGHEDCKIMQ